MTIQMIKCLLGILMSVQDCHSYTVLNDADRATGYSSGGASLKCDQNRFVKKWYRFTGAAGSAMPTKSAFGIIIIINNAIIITVIILIITITSNIITILII
ncbi:hypothetical protein QZH41_003862 [Actinostola sp. cb2023]|nr:hypothetical protein QZH41_003862 [Actinostola sp. cb2023]